MVLSELLDWLEKMGLKPTERQIRFAVSSKRVPKPRKNGAGMFVFSDDDANKIARYFTARQESQKVLEAATSE